MSDLSVRIHKSLKCQNFAGAVRRASICAGKFLASFSGIKCGFEYFNNPFDVKEWSGDQFADFSMEFQQSCPGNIRLVAAAKRAERVTMFMKPIDQFRMQMEVSFFEKKTLVCRLVVKLSCSGHFTGWEWMAPAQ